MYKYKTLSKDQFFNWTCVYQLPHDFGQWLAQFLCGLLPRETAPVDSAILCTVHQQIWRRWLGDSTAPSKWETYFTK